MPGALEFGINLNTSQFEEALIKFTDLSCILMFRIWLCVDYCEAHLTGPCHERAPGLLATRLSQVEEADQLSLTEMATRALLDMT